MARPLRIQWEGAWYHITSRENDRQLIFRNDEDRGEFLGRLSEMTERYRLRLHAYTLMDNHWHGLLETLEANLSRAMQWLNSGYSGWFNRQEDWAGDPAGSEASGKRHADFEGGVPLVLGRQQVHRRQRE